MNHANRTTETSLQATHETWQLSGVVLRLRENINVSFRDYRSETVAIIEDELTSQFWRIGMAEYAFLSQLNGQTTFATALGRTAAVMHDRALTEERAATFCQWLVQSGIASTSQSNGVQRLREYGQEQHRRKLRSMFSAISQRIPILNPDSFFDWLNPVLGWLFSKVILVPWLGLISTALVVLFLNWNRFTSETNDVLSAQNWMWGIITWAVLKVFHESAHALACKRFGGYVREAGVLFLLFIPLPYVDLTSSWRFTSKWKRILTSSAGMLAEVDDCGNCGHCLE